MADEEKVQPPRWWYHKTDAPAGRLCDPGDKPAGNGWVSKPEWLENTHFTSGAVDQQDALGRARRLAAEAGEPEAEARPAKKPRA